MRGLSIFSRFGAMPMGVQMALGAGSLGVMGLFYLAWFFWRSGSGWIIIIGIGIALVILCFSIYGFLRKRKADRRGKEFTKEMATLPGQGDKAQDASFSRAFEEGIDKYRQTGRRLMDQPWFLVIGEPSSGKTKAIKRSIRFDSLLTEPRQGSGGTQNMDWWFAQDAVIVDTAGKMAFPENAERVSSTWSELLRKLKKARPFAPINGVLLFISAESIQEKTVEQLQDEARVANTRLREINRDLGVRFPVWVIVSKSDKITGFREMLNELTAAEEQHQIFGWSNPVKISSAESDKPFDAKGVQGYIDEVAGNVERLRMSVIQNPTPQAIAVDPDARRLDEVDELYQLPQALRRIGYRLQLYLEEAMSQGVSGAPLFMRGIYFTSAEQKGDVLDLLLAEQLDIPVSDLRRPVGEGEDDPSRDYGSPYFLKDLFERKVFDESGLVTAQRSVGKAETRRRMWMMGGIAASALLVIGLGYWASGALDDKIGRRSEFWHEVAQATPRTVVVESSDDGSSDASRFRLVTVDGDGYRYDGGKQLAIGHDDQDGGGEQLSEHFEGGGSLPRGKTYGYQLPLRTLRYSTDFKEPKAGGLAWAFFWPAQVMAGDPFKTQGSAHNRLMVDSVIGPVVLAAYEEMARGLVASEEAASNGDAGAGDGWTQERRAAAVLSLAELLKIEAGDAIDGGPIDIEPLVRFVVFDGDPGAMEVEGADGVPSAAAQLVVLQKCIDDTYGAESKLGGDGEWPPVRLGSVRPGEDAVDKAVRWFVASQIAQSKDSRGADGAWARLERLQGFLRDYQEAEAELLKVSFGVDTEREYGDKWTKWKRHWEELNKAHDGLRDAWDVVVKTKGGDGNEFGKLRVQQAIDEATRQVHRGPKENYDLLLGIVSAAGEGASATETLNNGGSLAAIEDGSDDLVGAKATLEGGWDDFKKQLEAGEGTGDQAGEGSQWQTLNEYANVYLRGDGEVMDPTESTDPKFESRFEAMGELAALLEVTSPTGDARTGYARSVADDSFAKVRQTLKDTRQPLLSSTGDDNVVSRIAGALARVDGTDGPRQYVLELATGEARYRRFHAIDSALDAIGSEPSGKSIEAVVGGRDMEVDRIQRGAVALTGVGDGSRYDKRFRKVSAEGVLGAIDAILSERVSEDGAIPLKPLDAQKLNRRIEPLGNAREKYLGKYFNYWSQTVVHGLVPGGVTWDVARKAFADGLDVQSVNGLLKAEFSRVREALKAEYIEHLGSEAEKQAAERRVASISAALALYDKTNVPDIKKWRARLAGDSAGLANLVEALREVPKSDESHALLTEEIFGPANVEASDYYWSGLMGGLLKIAGDEGARTIAEALEFVDKSAAMRPLSFGGTGSLSFEEISSKARIVQGAAAGGGGVGWDGGTISGLPVDTQEDMRRLLGIGELKEDQRKRFGDFADLMTVIAGEQGGKVEELRFEVVLVDFQDVFNGPGGRESPLSDDDKPKYNKYLSTYPWLNYSFGEGELSDARWIRVDGIGDGKVRKLGELLASTGVVRIGFAPEKGAGVGEWGELRGDWDLLMSLVRTNTSIKIGVETYWLAKMKKSGSSGAGEGGEDLDYYIGLRVVNEGKRGDKLAEILKDKRWR